MIHKVGKFSVKTKDIIFTITAYLSLNESVPLILTIQATYTTDYITPTADKRREATNYNACNIINEAVCNRRNGRPGPATNLVQRDSELSAGQYSLWSGLENTLHVCSVLTA